MMKKIPDFKTDAEEREFWANVNLREFLGETDSSSTDGDDLQNAGQTAAQIAEEKRVADGCKRRITLRLDPEQIDAAKRLAAAKGMGYQTLIRLWVVEGIARERGST